MKILVILDGPLVLMTSIFDYSETGTRSGRVLVLVIEGLLNQVDVKLLRTYYIQSMTLYEVSVYYLRHQRVIQ